MALEGLRSFIADLPVVAVVRQCPRASVLQVLVVNCVLRTMLAVSKRFRRILPDACKSLYVRKAPLAYVLAKEAQNEAGLQHSTTVFFLCCFTFLLLTPGLRWQERNGPFRRCCSTSVAKVCIVCGKNFFSEALIWTVPGRSMCCLCYGGLLEAVGKAWKNKSDDIDSPFEPRPSHDGTTVPVIKKVLAALRVFYS